MSEAARALFVLGMHRSGTSAVAGTIHHAGVPLGAAPDRMRARPENPRGYWESTALTLFNEELLEAFGGSWSAPPELPSGWTRDSRLVPLRDLGRDLVATVHGAAQNTLWGWKDPRNSLLLPFWRDVLGVRPVIVLSHRNPLEVAESLVTWRGLAKPLGLALWERYVRSAIENTRGLPMLVVPYAGLLGEPRRWEKMLADFLLAEGFASPTRSEAAPSSFLERELRHSTRGPEDVARDPDMTEEQRALFQLLEDLVASRDVSRLAALPPESRETGRRIEEQRAAERAAKPHGAANGFDRESVLESAELDPLEDPPRYRARLDEEHPAREAARARLREIAAADSTTRVTVLCHVGRRDRLARALGSLRGQIDPRWQLCLAEAPGDRAAALNAAFETARGDLVMLFDADDALAPEAVASIIRALDADPDAELLYADEDSIDDDGRRRDPLYKPDWSPDFLTSVPYLGRPLVLRRGLFERLGGLRSGFAGAEDYDLALRASELARKVRHLPEVLHHRGRAADLDVASARRALAAALERRGESARIEDAEVPGGFHVRRAIRGRPRVSIVIPFRDEAVFLERCVRSIHELAGYDDWEALLVDNRSWQPETKALLRRLAADRKIRLLADPAPFNWSAINNRAAREAGGDHLLFLNDDVEARRAGWLAAMIEHSQRDEVGAVGARLLYPDETVQHAGLMLHREALARHPFRFLPASAPGYLGMARLIRNVTAVTGACLMVRRAVFEALGGFDESLPLAFNDVDFCLRLQARGYRVVYTPLAELVHHEGISRGLVHESASADVIARRWAKEIAAERYVSPRLGWRATRHEIFDKEGAT